MPARAVLLERLAGLHEQQLKDPKAAAFALQRLFELQHDVAHAGLLVALHQRHSQWPEAINMLLATRLSARDVAQGKLSQLMSRPEHLPALASLARSIAADTTV